MTGDFSHYAEQGMQFGTTVAYEVTELVNADGSHPIIHVEHLGSTNASMLEELIARASVDEKDAAAKPSIVEVNRLNRESVARHSARRIERVFLGDGTAATNADIPAFISALPVMAFDRLMRFVLAEGNFCKFPIAEKPAALAEK